MNQKDSYIYRIMKKHKVLVDFDGEVKRRNVPSTKKGETFKQWTERVLGQGVTNVVVLEWYVPGPRKQMSTLKKYSGAGMVKRLMSGLKRDGKADKKAIANEKIDKYTTFPRNSLKDVLAELSGELQPPVKESLQNILETADENLEFDELLEQLIRLYNNAVRMARQ